MSQPRPQLPGITSADLEKYLADWGEPRYRAAQIMNWRNRGITSPADMLNIPARLRERLYEEVECEPLSLERRQVSTDGTRKYLFTLQSSGKAMETVFIPETGRGTVCVSSQLGCVLDCPFCYTGTQGFTGNLSAGEIVAQILAVKRDLLSDPPAQDICRTVTHIVYMGMGEPLANEPGVHGSLGIIHDALNISHRRITVSTSGLVPQIGRLGITFPVNLAISLHAATDELRDVLVPINRKYPLQQLRQCLNSYPLGKQRHITLEYVMLADVNDRPEDLEALARFVSPERERINLISFNPYPGNPYTGSSKEHMNRFAKDLIKKGIRATVRRSRGQDIMAACGQLKADIAGI